MTNMNTKPIGVFDSGIGGITVLAKAIEQLPGERFIYFGDSANAPYGGKEAETVIQLTINAANFLLKKGVKALVVACNTATSVAIEELRNKMIIPVVGMEPALKPAVEAGRGGAIIVMATPLTLKEKKFNLLMENYSYKSNIIPLPCPGLVELIESGVWEGSELQKYLAHIFSNTNINNITDVVLGCTHYIFIKNEIIRFFNSKIKVVDGNEGAARQLRRLLTTDGFYKPDMHKRAFDETLQEYYFSDPKEKVLNLCKEWLKGQL